MFQNKKIFTILALIRGVEQFWGSFACDTLSRAGAPNSVFVQFDPDAKTSSAKAAFNSQNSALLGLGWKEEFVENLNSKMINAPSYTIYNFDSQILPFLSILITPQQYQILQNVEHY